MTEWRPANQAPLDGTWIFALHDDLTGCATISWDEDMRVWVAPDGECDREVLEGLWTAIPPLPAGAVLEIIGRRWAEGFVTGRRHTTDGKA